MTKRKEGSGARVWRSLQKWTNAEILEQCIEEGNCLIWQGGLNKGVPYIRHGGKQLSLRPHMYTEIWGKRLYPEYQAVPDCGNRRCISRDCLISRHRSTINQGRADKMALDPVYMENKRRQARAVGIAKLQPNDVERIRVAQGSAQQVAKAEGVHPDTIRRIWAGHTYAPPRVANSIFNLAGTL